MTNRLWTVAPAAIVALVACSRSDAPAPAAPAEAFHWRTLPSAQRADYWAGALRGNPHGIPAGARMRASQELQTSRNSGIHTESISGAWTRLGPAPIDNGQSWPGFGTSQAAGRVTSVAANPSDPHGQLWIGTASGGVWRRDANTTTWVPMTDDAPSLAIGALALDNCSANGCTTVYAGTGENAFRRDTYYGAGVLKLQYSSGGEFPSWGYSVLGGDVFAFGSIQNLLMDPSSPVGSRTLYATLSRGETSNAVDASITAPTPTAGFGVYKSTNGGTNWTNVGPSVAGAAAVDMVMDPQNPAVLYAAFANHGIYKSTTGGASWTALNTGIPAATVTAVTRPALTISHDSASSPAVLYSVFGICGSPHMHGTPYGGCVPTLFRLTDDGAQSWQLKTATTQNSVAPGQAGYGTALFQYAEYTHAMLVLSNSNAQSMIFGGINLWKTVDGGNNFDGSPSVIGNDGIHPDYHALVQPDKTDPNYILATNDGGLYSSTNGGVAWNSENNFLQITEFQSIAVSPTSSSVIGGTQDNGTNLFNGFLRWERQDGGDSADAFFDIDNPATMYDVYTDVEPRRIAGGLNAPDITNGLTTTDPVAFYPPMVQAKTGPAPHPVYFGTNRVYRCSDISQPNPTWTPVSPVVGGTATYYADVDSTNVITALAIAPSATNRIYIGHYDGQIWVTDGASTAAGAWVSIGGSAKGLPNRAVTSIAVDPDNADIAYAAYSGFGNLSGDSGFHVYQTLNRGGSWQQYSNGLSVHDPANAIAIEKGAPKRLWLATDHGVFARLTTDAAWTQSVGLPSVPVYALALDEPNKRIYAGTHGRGAWVMSPTPIVQTFEGWVDGQIWDIPTYGTGFFPNQTCAMAIRRRDGSICAQGTTDAQGSAISTDANGQIVSSNGSQWSGKPVAWACYNGNCLGNTPIANCNVAGNPISQVEVKCGSQDIVGPIGNCPSSGNPPSTGLAIQPPLGGTGAPMAFSLFGAVQSGDGSTRSLCSVNVPFLSNEADDVILKRAAGAMTSSPACSALSVSAGVTSNPTSRDSEDGEDVPPRLLIHAPTVTGSQLFTGVRTQPGSATGMCFAVGNLGLPGAQSLMIPKLSFDTGSGTAKGGGIRLTESSFIGNCSVAVPTTAGQTGTALAAAVQAALSTTSAKCPAIENLRDTRLDTNTLTFVAAREIVVCIDDPGIGISLRPEEIVLNQPPRCEDEKDQNEHLLFGTDHLMVSINDFDATDPDGDPLTIKIVKVTQDEPTSGVAGGSDRSPDAVIGAPGPTPHVDLRAEWAQYGNGRVYEVTWTATDPFGASCTGTWRGCAPRGGYGSSCKDDGQTYDSTKP